MVCKLEGKKLRFFSLAAFVFPERKFFFHNEKEVTIKKLNKVFDKRCQEVKEFKSTVDEIKYFVDICNTLPECKNCTFLITYFNSIIIIIYYSPLIVLLLGVTDFHTKLSHPTSISSYLVYIFFHVVFGLPLSFLPSTSRLQALFADSDMFDVISKLRISGTSYESQHNSILLFKKSYAKTL